MSVSWLLAVIYHLPPLYFMDLKMEQVQPGCTAFCWPVQISSSNALIRRIISCTFFTEERQADCFSFRAAGSMTVQRPLLSRLLHRCRQRFLRRARSCFHKTAHSVGAWNIKRMPRLTVLELADLGLQDGDRLPNHRGILSGFPVVDANELLGSRLRQGLHCETPTELCGSQGWKALSALPRK